MQQEYKELHCYTYLCHRHYHDLYFAWKISINESVIKLSI
jgi:hypothetical protein